MKLQTALLRKVINGIIFYAAWFAAVVGAANDMAVEGAVVCLALFGVHLLITPGRKKEVLLMVSLAACGLAIDTMYMHYEVLRFASNNSLFPHLAPFWIVCLYALYATTIDHSLQWLGTHPLLTSVVGACGAGFSYSVGVNMNAVELLLPGYTSLFVIGGVWLVFAPFSFWYARCLDRRLKG